MIIQNILKDKYFQRHLWLWQIDSLGILYSFSWFLLRRIEGFDSRWHSWLFNDWAYYPQIEITLFIFLQDFGNALILFLSALLGLVIKYRSQRYAQYFWIIQQWILGTWVRGPRKQCTIEMEEEQPEAGLGMPSEHATRALRSGMTLKESTW